VQCIAGSILIGVELWPGGEMHPLTLPLAWDGDGRLVVLRSQSPTICGLII